MLVAFFVAGLLELARGDLRGDARAPLLVMNIHASKMFVEDGALKVLGQRIREIVLAVHFLQGKISGAQPILHPEIGHVQVWHAAESLSPANAYGCAGVGPELQGPLHAEVVGDCL